MENPRLRDRALKRATKIVLWGSVSAFIVAHFLYNGMLRKKNIEDSVSSK